MKKMMLASLALVLLVSLTALAQYPTTKQDDQTKQENPKAEKASAKAQTISGKVSADGKTITSEKDNKTWTVSNADALKGHEGHEVTVKAHVDAAKNEIHIVSVKMGKGEMKPTTKKDEMPK